jgi:replicative DNA helicase
MSKASKHYDTEAEMAVVGTLLEKPEYIRRIPWLRTDDFFDENCMKIFKAYTESGPTDISGVPHSKIIECQDSIVSPELIIGYAKTVKEWSLKRKLINIHESGASPEEIITRIKDLERELPFALIESEPYTLTRLIEDTKITPEGFKTGYRNLDKYITIPMGGVTIIAGRPAHGKTTFLLNVCLRMIELYQDKSFFFFSYEDNKRQVALRILNTLSEYVIEQRSYQNIYQLENYLRGENTSIKQIENGKNKFARLTEERRLWIIDEPYHIDELIKVIAGYHDKYNVGAVFIDWLQRITAKGKYQTRQLALQDILRQLVNVSNKLSLPIILGCQFGRAGGDKETKKNTVRMDNLREAGDIEQDSKIVLGLWNEAMEKKRDEETVKDEKIDLSVTILKNREGISNKDVDLVFNAPVLKIEDTLL